MSPSTFVLLSAGLLVFMAWYANSSKRNKILCTFRRANKTKVVKWVKMQARYVIFDGGKYDIIPSRVVFQWYTAGLVHMLFPQWVATLDYTYGKRLPLDSNRADYDWENPEVRKAINISDIVKSYFATSSPAATSKKAGLLTAYLPWIAIGLVVLVAFYFNSKMTSFGAALDAVINQLNSIAR